LHQALVLLTVVENNLILNILCDKKTVKTFDKRFSGWNSQSFRFHICLIYLPTDSCFISLTLNSTQFAKLAMVLAQSLMLIHTSEREALVTETLVMVFTGQAKHLEDSARNEKYKSDVRYIFTLYTLFYCEIISFLFFGHLILCVSLIRNPHI